MKYLFVLALLGTGGWYGYKHILNDSDAVKAYKEFANAVAEDKFDKAASLAEGEATSFVDKIRQEREIKREAPKGGFQGMWDAAGKQQIKDIRGTSDQTDYKILSEVKNVDGSVSIEAQQTDKRSSPEGGSPRVFFWKHRAMLQSTGATWKVTAFAEENAR